MEMTRLVTEVRVRLLPYGIALAIPLIAVSVVRCIRIVAPSLIDGAHHSTMIPLSLQRLQTLSEDERRKLTLFFAASPEWKVIQVLNSRKEITDEIQISKREERDGALQIPENVVHVGGENPPQTFLDIFLKSAPTEATGAESGEQSVPLTSESVHLLVQAPDYGDSRLTSRLVLAGAGIRVVVKESSQDISRPGTKRAISALEGAVEVALQAPLTTPPKAARLSSSGCIARRMEIGRDFSIRGVHALKQPGVLFVELVGKVSGKMIENTSSDRELVGGPEEAFATPRPYYYDFEARLPVLNVPGSASDYRVKLMFDTLKGGDVQELATCTVEETP